MSPLACPQQLLYHFSEEKRESAMNLACPAVHTAPPRLKHGNEKSERGTLALSILAPCDNQCTTSEVEGEAEDGQRLLPSRKQLVVTSAVNSAFRDLDYDHFVILLLAEQKQEQDPGDW
jgi:hypothetical protein